ncbi:hypothetical protein [Nonomuraea africana]|uniref:DUF5709 domain-containing protein n=1 Tax=Nonomuraea africana TaxID=46171 RepID=A0ABR9KKS0_9ACTN|nr:hypothetical protein [Nonomuraea africana]MBE1562604.1 hypothetical protein [Nonomuraea africana]
MSETPDARYTGEEAAERVDRALNDDASPDEVDQRDAQVVADTEAAPVRPERGPYADEDAEEGDPEEAAHRETLWDGSAAPPRADEGVEPPD